jgi:hypothetical protein
MFPSLSPDCSPQHAPLTSNRTVKRSEDSFLHPRGAGAAAPACFFEGLGIVRGLSDPTACRDCE